jgi:hypothetical protein
MEALLDLLAHLDWFERLDEYLRSARGVRSWRFCVPRDCGWSGHQIEKFLRRYGIRIWGRNFSREHLFFRVKLRQANWAEYLLRRRDIPVCGPLFNPLNAEYGVRHAPGSEPRPAARRATWIEKLLSPF